jgi:hypothetical protein
MSPRRVVFAKFSNSIPPSRVALCFRWVWVYIWHSRREIDPSPVSADFTWALQHGPQVSRVLAEWFARDSAPTMTSTVYYTPNYSMCVTTLIGRKLASSARHIHFWHLLPFHLAELARGRRMFAGASAQETNGWAVRRSSSPSLLERALPRCT